MHPSSYLFSINSAFLCFFYKDSLWNSPSLDSTRYVGVTHFKLSTDLFFKWFLRFIIYGVKVHEATSDWFLDSTAYFAFLSFSTFIDIACSWILIPELIEADRFFTVINYLSLSYISSSYCFIKAVIFLCIAMLCSLSWIGSSSS